MPCRHTTESPLSLLALSLPSPLCLLGPTVPVGPHSTYLDPNLHMLTPLNTILRMHVQGISARCEAVLALRQAHGFAFGKSDLFVVLAMRPTPDDQQPTHQVRVCACVLGLAWVHEVHVEKQPVRGAGHAPHAR